MSRIGRKSEVFLRLSGVDWMYVPSKELVPNADLAALQNAVAKLEACLHAADVSEDSLVEDFTALRQVCHHTT